MTFKELSKEQRDIIIDQALEHTINKYRDNQEDPPSEEKLAQEAAARALLIKKVLQSNS